ncbi:cholesterol 7-desaturase-like, partial [Acanthaster planci]|uniref:Cholesterol 7-desaturase-like n=1 Tax=Acanthaster planci TaxID=133434 RepID=A0A8B7ZC65_ACAPL
MEEKMDPVELMERELEDVSSPVTSYRHVMFRDLTPWWTTRILLPNLDGTGIKTYLSPLALQFNEARNSYLIEKGQAGLTKEGIIATMKRRRRVGDVPPVYPNGLNLAVFRGESGKAYIVDPYCPHLGANLAVGGKVTGECIECPFHGWAFQGEDGKCVKIAYTDKVPDSIKVPTYRSLEINDMILLWFHAEGEEPSWYPPEIEKIKSGEVKFNGIFEAYVNCHIQ